MFLITCKPEHGDAFDVRADTRDIYVWEKTNKGRTLKSFMDELSMIDLYKIAHIACRRAGLVDVSLEEFTKSHELDFEEEDDADPTPPAP